MKEYEQSNFYLPDGTVAKSLHALCMSPREPGSRPWLEGRGQGLAVEAPLFLVGLRPPPQVSLDGAVCELHTFWWDVLLGGPHWEWLRRNCSDMT